MHVGKMSKSEFQVDMNDGGWKHFSPDISAHNIFIKVIFMLLIKQSV